MDIETIKQEALKDHVPIIMDDTLEVIIKLLKENHVERILEIGTAVGYSAICFSKYVSKIDTIEKDITRVKQAKENIQALHLENKINIIAGDAVEILPKMTENYDFIFIDASKSKYPIFLEEGIRLCRNNGYIIADNVLYKGYVMGDYNKHKQRTAVKKLREFMKTIQENPILESNILEVGDGLAICKVKK